MSGCSYTFPAASAAVIPALPSAWVQHCARPLTARTGTASVPSSWREFATTQRFGHGHADLARLLAALDGAHDDPDADMCAAVGFATLTVRMQRGAHETLAAVSWRVLSLAVEGHPGADYALRQVYSAFIAESDRRRRLSLPGVRDEGELDREIDRAIFGAIAKLGMTA